MTRMKKDTALVEVLRDGVFHAEDMRADKGEKVECDPAIAAKLIENGHARAA